ncbi:DUF1896 family protein [Parasediminibacterium paludis]|jgi:hypothetical protein|uniref:DUF1896 family protein n=1 Tax=Parasediminibacterium paludis TaxID=908966 RepID=A0ABV8Q0G7_9BACT
MQEILTEKLHEYIINNNLNLLIELQQEGKVDTYLQEKVATADELISQLQSDNTPSYIIEEQCLDLLTKDLRPSKFNYVLRVLEEDFEKQYQQFREAGILTYETINLIAACNPVFEALGFTTDNEDDKQLRYAITGTVKQYLDKQ